jgi:hypothetical protein
MIFAASGEVCDLRCPDAIPGIVYRELELA